MTLKDIFKISIDVSNIQKAKGSIDEIAKAVKGLNAEQVVYRMELADCSEKEMISVMRKNKLSQADIKASIAKRTHTSAIKTDTTATNVDTASKYANLKVTNMLKVAWSKFMAFAKANPYLMLAAGVTAFGAVAYKVLDYFNNTEKYAKKALDKTAEKVDEARSEVESLNSELETTQSRIDELSTKENLTLVEQDELDRLKETNKELERELRLKQSILSEEEKEANKDAKKYFNTKTEGTDYVFYDYGEDIEKVDYITAVEKRIDKLQQYADGKIYLAEETIASYKDYIESAISDFMEEDDYLVEGKDDGLLDRLDSLYEKFDIYTNGRGSVVEDKIKGILSKADFLNEAKRLEELGKNGNLSKDTLKDTNGEFADLVEYLDKAGVEAEELYQYIMAIANPNAINVDETRKQLMNSLGLGETISSASEAQVWGEISKLGDEQTVLEAYLKVKAQFGDSPEGWTAEDWAHHIQEEINSVLEDNETTIQLGISETVDELNTKLKPTMDSLADAYHDIFTEDGFTLDSVGVDMLQSIKGTIDELNSNEELGISIDYSAFEEFAQVLSDTSSTSEQVHEQFDKLSTAIVYATGSAEVSSENFTVLSKALTEIGLSNSVEVLNQIMNAQNAYKAVSEELGYTLEEVANATYQETVQMLIQAQAAGQDTSALWQLAIAQGKITDGTISTESNVEALMAEAQAAGLDLSVLTTLEKVRTGKIKDSKAAQAILENTKKQIMGSMSEFKLDFDFSPATKSAGKAGKDAGEEYKEALENELSDLDKIIGYIGDLFNDEIDALETAKDNAVQALEDARDKEIDALESQKSALEDYKDALEDAIETRKLNMQLQQAEYNLQKMLSQRTSLIYSESKGMHYVQDLKGAREAKEEVENIKLDIQLHEIDEQIEDIDDEIKKVEEKYEKLISDTEAYYDSQIKSLELLKEQVEGITKAAENQEVIELLKKYGINVSDILSGNEEALAKLKDKYLEVSTALSNYEATGAMDDLTTSSDKASDSVSKVADATTQIDDEKVANLSSAMEGLGDTSNLELLYDAFDQLKTIITEISDTLNGVDKEGGLVSALNELTKLSLGTTGEEATGLIGQFIALKDAIDAVTTAISGGAQGQNLPQGGAPTMQGAMTPSGSPDSGGTGGLKQAIKEQVEEATTLLPDEIAKFAGEEDSLEGAVQKVITKVAGASGEESGQEGKEQQSESGEADPTNLKGAIQAQYEKAEEVIVPLEVPMFEQLRDVILECVDGLNNMVTAMQSMSEISLGGDMQFGLINFHSEGTVGKAFAKGTGKYKGLPHDEKLAIRSEYGQPETTIYPDGTVELTTEPTASSLPKDTVILNEEQTKKMLSNKGEVLGNAFANGTDIPTIKPPTNLPSYLRPLQEGDKMYDLVKKFDAHNELIQSQIIPPVNSIQKNMDMMTRNISNVNNTNNQRSIQVNMGDIVCKGVTAQEVAGEIGSALKRELGGMYQSATQIVHTTR